MSQTISIDVPEAVLERFSRIAGAANRPVEDLLVNALTKYAPRPPGGLPENLHRELEQMENLPDDELWQVFRQSMDPEALPPDYVPGGIEDRLMLCKAFAGLLLQWRGHQLPVPGAYVSPAAQPAGNTGTLSDWMGSGAGFTLAAGASLEDPAFTSEDWEDTSSDC